MNINNIFLHRSRLDALLTKGLEKPLVTVAAASGYGKTHLVRSFFENRQERVVWIPFTKHDNITTFFWQKFVRSVGVVLPSLARAMEYIGFPDSSSKFEELLKHMTKAIYTGERVVFVADDYDNIFNHDVRLFFENLVEMGIENCCLVLIKGDNLNINVCLDKALHISAQDLAFTKKEAAEFLRLRGINCSAEMFAKLYADTEGWPIALNLLTEQFGKSGFNAELLSIPSVTDFFEKECFSGFEQSVQMFLLKLSLFQSFCSELVEKINGGVLENALEELKQHPFVVYDVVNDVFCFQKMYYDFLETRYHLLTDEEVAETYRHAGEHFQQYDMYYRAAKCFFAGKDYRRLMNVLLKLPRKPLNREYCDTFLGYIDSLPREFLEGNYFADYAKAFLLLNNLELEEAGAIFLRLKEQMEDGAIKDNDNLLGEIYLALADISARMGSDDFSYYYKKAYDHLPDGSRILTRKVLMLGNNQAFFLSSNQPGELEKMTKAIFDTAAYAETVTQGSGSGYAWLFLAEAGYMVYDLDKAEACAKKALYDSLGQEQHDIVCNAYMLLAKVSVAKGDYDGAEKQINKIIHYVNAINVNELFELRDCIESWFNIIIGNLDKLPNWMDSYRNDSYSRYPIDAARSSLVYAICLMARGDYTGANSALAQTEGLCAQKTHWTLRIVSHLMKAVCFYKTGDEENAVKYFDKGYDMAYNNNIIMPFVEFSSVMHPVLELARDYPGYDFDKGWLDMVYEKINFYETNFIHFINERYRENRVVSVPENNLSEVEFAVLKMMANGKTAEDIQKNFTGDVKKITVDIYNKLGAVNKFDAIRIAKNRKYM